jgi:hypothetical protein
MSEISLPDSISVLDFHSNKLYGSLEKLFLSQSLAHRRKEHLIYEKKHKIRQVVEEGKPVPTELRNEEVYLRKKIDLEDDQTLVF